MFDLLGLGLRVQGPGLQAQGVGFFGGVGFMVGALSFRFGKKIRA